MSYRNREDRPQSRQDDGPRGNNFDGGNRYHRDNDRGAMRDGDRRGDSSPSRGRMGSDSRPMRDDDHRQPASAFTSGRGGRGGTSPSRGEGRGGGYGAPPSRGAYDGGSGGRGGYERRDDRGEHRSGRADDSYSRRDDHDDRVGTRGGDRGGRDGGRAPAGNFGNDVRGGGRDDNRGERFERDEGREGRGGGERGGRDFSDRNGRNERGGFGEKEGGRGGYGGDRDEGGRGGRGGGFSGDRDNAGRGGFGERDSGRGGGLSGDRDRDGGRGGGFSGDRDRDGGRGGGFSGDRDRDGGARGGFGSRGGRDDGYNDRNADRDGGFGGGRGGGGGYGGGSSNFGRGGGRGGYDGDRGSSRGGFGGDRGETRNGYGGGSRDDGGFGNGGGGGGFNEDRNGSSFGGGRGGFSGRGGRGGGYGGDRGGGFGGDRGGGFGGDRGGGFGGDRGGGFGGDRGGGFGGDRGESGFGGGRGGGFGGDRNGGYGGNNDSGFGGGYNRSGFGDRGPERDMDAKNQDGTRKYAARGYKTQLRSVNELYDSDARNAENQVLDCDMPVKLTGKDADTIHPIQSWEESGLDRSLIDICTSRCKYTTVRPIQAIGIPAIMAGRDILAQSETGSGKSAAFMLPIVHEIITSHRSLGPGKVVAIMVAPTRELITQLIEQAHRFTNGVEDIRVVHSIGQSDYVGTLTTLSSQGAHILIATIGRLKDHIQKGHITLDSLRYFVLDEADRMLEDRNGTRDMDAVFDHPKWPKKDLQYLLFSATIPTSVRQYAMRILKDNYLMITPDADIGANKKIKQYFYLTEGQYDKNKQLLDLLEKEAKESEDEGRPFKKTLIFVNRKEATNILAVYCSLNFNKVKAQSLHGDKGQDLRDEAINQFRTGQVKILIGTDVCERGLDIEALEHVINYDMPTEGERYTHRIGRTGRVRGGMATSFISSESAGILPTIVTIAKASAQEVPEWMENMANGAGAGGFNNAASFGKSGGGFGSGFDSGSGGGFGQANGFGDTNSSSGFGSGAANGFDSAPAGGGFEAANGFGSAAADDGSEWVTKDETENAFDVGRVKDSLDETTKTPAPATTAIPAEFKTQNNDVGDDDW